MTVFYRKYRPQKLSEIVGQESVTKVLLGQLESGKISHGYLFAGPRGTGKTSTARILAKAVNCQGLGTSALASSKKNKNYTLDSNQLAPKFSEPCNKCESCVAITNGSYLDLIEIDAASNRGIDEIRDLREKIKLVPVSGRFKVYIIDEAHMLTNEAFNALLKTLEEPPAHAIFILCTTEEQKLPATVISRLSRFNFQRAKTSDLSLAIEKIARSEGLKIDKDATRAIAIASDGSYRDAISILDQLSVLDEITEKDVLGLVKSGGLNRTYSFLENLVNKNLKELVNLIEGIVESGGDAALFNREVILLLKKLLFVKIGIKDDAGKNDLENAEQMDLFASELSFEEVQNLMKLFLIAEGEIKLYPLPQIPLILAVCKYCPAPVGAGQSSLSDVATDEEPKSSDKSEVSSTVVSQSQSEDTKEPKATKVAKSSKSLGEIEKHWGEFLAKVKPVNSPVVALLRSSRPLALSDDKLTIEVFYRFHKEKLEEPKIISMLERTLGEVTGKRIVLKFVLAQKSALPTREVRMSDVVEIDGEEISKLAAEIFSK